LAGFWYNDHHIANTKELAAKDAGIVLCGMLIAIKSRKFEETGKSQ
jgi:hypothetical protein